MQDEPIFSQPKTGRAVSGYSPIIAALGGRKFFIVLLSLVSATALVYFKAIEPIIYRDIMIYVIAAYVVGNVGQKWAEQWGTKTEK